MNFDGLVSLALRDPANPSLPGRTMFIGPLRQAVLLARSLDAGLQQRVVITGTDFPPTGVPPPALHEIAALPGFGRG